ncbi:MAG: ABC transporter ATP-binding protein [Chitinophagia bacterium]|nr:ABC transporter ATP-binding protein [Chitinophagia bacterium]
MDAITIRDVSKAYAAGKARTEALRGVSLDVADGELFGLIGPDGAGKTSLFRILTTLLLPDAGHASVNGLDVVKDYRRLRTQLGYMPGRFSLYTDLTVEENLAFFASIFDTDMRENLHLVQDIYTQIEPFRRFRAGNLSGGMKQKLALCCALIHRPRTLFLDEPTTGVDAVSRKEFWEMLKRLKAQGLTIVVSTPYMDEASLCDRVALIQQGRILRVDTPEGVRRGYGRRVMAVKGPGMLRTLERLEGVDGVVDAYPFGERVHAVVAVDPDRIVWPEELEAVEVTPDIEDCFISLMKESHD